MKERNKKVNRSDLALISRRFSSSSIFFTGRVFAIVFRDSVCLPPLRGYYGTVPEKVLIRLKMDFQL